MSNPIRAGLVQFGDFRRLSPVSDDWGFDRGQPIDRYYIERFFLKNADDVAGRVLEIGDATYSRQVGGDRVSRFDVLHQEDSPGTTIVDDLTHAVHIPPDTFDCVLLPQTLQYIYDLHAAIRTIHRVLRPKGVVLATFPGISRTSEGSAGDRANSRIGPESPWMTHWCWNLTPLSGQRLFEEAFGDGRVRVEGHGNVLVAMSFLHGLAAHELTRDELDYHQRGYEVLIAVRAVKP
jgi:SAM-dependent methyltransferase